jgi:DNA-binding GntR family transcriptional regulator
MGRIQFAAGRSKRDQVSDDLRKRIASGDLAVGDSLGDVFTMGTDYEVSHGTVRNAQRVLVAEGLLSEIKIGVPTRVIAKPVRSSADGALEALRRLHHELEAVIRQVEQLT